MPGHSLSLPPAQASRDPLEAGTYACSTGSLLPGDHCCYGDISCPLQLHAPTWTLPSLRAMDAESLPQLLAAVPVCFCLGVSFAAHMRPTTMKMMKMAEPE